MSQPASLVLVGGGFGMRQLGRDERAVRVPQ